jgi:predicted ester cyclase
MAETLGSLCDKLTIVKLKQWHAEDPIRLASLDAQEKQLCDEINEFVNAAIKGHIPLERLTFAANKVFKKEGNVVADIQGNIGDIFSQLAAINCKLWHEVEKGYEIEKIPPEGKNIIIKQLAILNLERNQCIDKIDQQFRLVIEKLRTDL